jgi:type IV pilus assembly protein PilN
MSGAGSDSASDAVVACPGGFNLLPYRQRRALRAKRGLRAQLAWAGMSGVALAAGLAAWQAQDIVRLEAQYAGLAQQWASLAPALAVEAGRRDRAERAVRLARRRAEAAAQRERFVHLLALLSRRARGDLELGELHHRVRGATLRGRSETYQALQAWIGTLERDSLLHRVAIADLGGPAGPRSAWLPAGARDGKAAAHGGAVAFTLQIDYVADGGAESPTSRP